MKWTTTNDKELRIMKHKLNLLVLGSVLCTVIGARLLLGLLG